MKILSLLLFLALAIPSLATSQSARETAAEKSWASFYSAFQAAVTKRDRVALKKMLVSPFDSGGGGPYTPAKWVKFIDEENLWGQLKKSVAAGTRPFPEYSQEHKKPRRLTKDRYLIFAFGKDGQWRWVAVMGD